MQFAKKLIEDFINVPETDFSKLSNSTFTKLCNNLYDWLTVKPSNMETEEYRKIIRFLNIAVECLDSSKIFYTEKNNFDENDMEKIIEVAKEFKKLLFLLLIDFFQTKKSEVEAKTNDFLSKEEAEEIIKKYPVLLNIKRFKKHLSDDDMDYLEKVIRKELWKQFKLLLDSDSESNAITNFFVLKELITMDDLTTALPIFLSKL